MVHGGQNEIEILQRTMEGAMRDVKIVAKNIMRYPMLMLGFEDTIDQLAKANTHRKRQPTVRVLVQHACHVTRPIDKVLVANRGEIACRVIRTAKRLGIDTVAVYSDADKNSLHVTLADEAYHIGPAPAHQSYLRQNTIISIAKRTGAQAIHPGYGFLSENAEFAELCEKEGVVFIGPPASAIRDMGIKSKSKSIMSSAGVPIIHGYHGDDQSVSRLREEASHIGYPIMIKAVRGGGGKGMRIAMSESEFDDKLNSAKFEAMKAFGDEVMLLEEFVAKPRHVEVQVFGDWHNNYVYLFERDCSVQRRHQKIIEEAPAPGLSAQVRCDLGQAAVDAARAVNYVGAGTVEFIMDPDHKFYFMEMNTRLQVEHPVTEMITNTDLVEWQIKVAAGEPLPLMQEDITVSGHAFEARIYAEDPNNAFMPCAGFVRHLSTPRSDATVRIETGVRQGDEVSVHYDPMIAKLVVWGEDRHSALRRTTAALREFKVVGLDTNLQFLVDLMSNSHFKAGEVFTDFISQHSADLFTTRVTSPTTLCQAVVAVLHAHDLQSRNSNLARADPFSPFVHCNNARLNQSASYHLTLQDGDRCIETLTRVLGGGKLDISIDGGAALQLEGEVDTHEDIVSVRCNVGGVISSASVLLDENRIYLFSQEGRFVLDVPLPEYVKVASVGGVLDDPVAPMPGVVERVLVHEDASVGLGEPLIVMVAMKMEYVIRAPRAGIVKKVMCDAGSTVAKGTVLVHIVEQSQDQNTDVN